ncbi:MAG: hypothetical protein K8R79_11520 [Calditrichales bacterium]|nr:hypothetical protein [Calditrichales bacterium]
MTCDFGDRDIININFVFFDKKKQQVKRPLKNI